MARPVHITVIAPYPVYPANTGGQKNIASFYEALADLHPVTIISTKKNAPPAGLKSAFLPLLSNGVFRYVNIFLFFQLRKILKKNNCTHLFIEHPYFGWLGLLLKWNCKVKLVVHSHNIEALRFKSIHKWWWGILWNYEKFTHRFADINFFITGEDRQYAIDKYKLPASRSFVITYGFDLNRAPGRQEKAEARVRLLHSHQLNATCRLLFFNGMLDYQPNLQAVDTILHQINPLLQNIKGFEYRILICGKNLPASYDGLKKYTSANIIYAGFVDDISLYYKGADIFINPVTVGGGIKTKLVEALGNDLYCISTAVGAYGVPLSLTNNRLKIVHEKGWHDFAEAIVKADPNTGSISKEFFDHFYWPAIARKAALIIEENYRLK